MNPRLLTLLGATALFGSVASSTHAAIIYTETFPNAGTNASFSTVGWNAHVGAAAGNQTNSNTDALVATAAGKDGSPGYGAKTGLTSGVALYWTTEIGTVDQTLLETISFFSNNSNTTDAIRIALRLDTGIVGDASDDLWFATNVGFIRNSTTAGSGTNWVANGELESFAFTNAASAWRDLTFTPNTTLSLATSARTEALPSGDVTAVGLYSSLASNVNSSNGGVLRFDTFQVSAVPEPGSALLALGGGTALLGLIRRRRR